MNYAENLWLYGVLLFGIIIVPGMDMLMVLGNALTGGRRAGFYTTAGTMFAGLFHTVWGALSVGVVWAMPPQLIKAMVIGGAGYMVWIGVSLLRSSIAIRAVGRGEVSALVALWRGFVTCALNPKAYLFTLSTFPLFIKPVWGPIWQQAIVMGVMTALMQAVVYGAVALAAHGFRGALLGNPAATVYLGRAVGAVFLALVAVMLWHEFGG